MSTLQIRNLPDDVKQALKERAEASGQSLSEYALAELRKSAARPTFGEISGSIDLKGRVDLGVAAAEAPAGGAGGTLTGGAGPASLTAEVSATVGSRLAVSPRKRKDCV